MSLITTLNIGKSALAAQQAAINVSSNNVANAGNPDYTRQVVQLSPSGDRKVGGVLVGSGVVIQSIQRQIDDALEGRIRSATSDSEAAHTRQDMLGQVESIFNALGDNDLSSQLSTFFNGWSNLANKPQDAGQRQIVLQNGESLATGLQSLRSQLGQVQTDIANRLSTLAKNADSLASQIAGLNEQISTTEGSGQQANALRDQRDAALKQLSQLIDIKTQDTGNGMVNVLVGSEPVVIGSTSRGLALTSVSSGGQLMPTLTTKDQTTINVGSGQIGATVALRKDLTDMAAQVDGLAGNLIFELNKIHASGQGLEGFSSLTASNGVNDTTAALDSAAAGLPFAPVNGSFVVHVKQKGTGLVTSTLVQVDLDGLSGNDTSLDSLQASLDAISGVAAKVNAGKLTVSAESGDLEISFSQDSSGTLAALGLNAFFTGRDAATIAVSSALKNNPSLMAVAQNGAPTDNQTARAIAAMESQPLAGLGGQSLKEAYQNLTNGLAVSVSAAKTGADAADTVSQTLSDQREALSGVSMDEEAINLIREQRAFQGAARVIAAVDEMMKTLLQMV